MFMAYINMKGGSWASQCNPHCLLATGSFSNQFLLALAGCSEVCLSVASVQESFPQGPWDPAHLLASAFSLLKSVLTQHNNLSDSFKI